MTQPGDVLRESIAARQALNRWERLRDMPPADEALLHYETADDPLDSDIICDGCKDDWPCDFERGRRSLAAPVAGGLDVDAITAAVEAAHPEPKWKDDSRGEGWTWHGIHRGRAHVYEALAALAASQPAPGLPHSIEVGSVAGSPHGPHAYNVRAEEE